MEYLEPSEPVVYYPEQITVESCKALVEKCSTTFPRIEEYCNAISTTYSLTLDSLRNSGHVEIADAIINMTSAYFLDNHLEKYFFGRPLQLTEYRPTSYREWHIDGGLKDNGIEKDNVDTHMVATMVIMLSQIEDYTGGKLKFFRYHNNKAPKVVGIGDIVMFPSFVWHRVTPIVSGVRRTLTVFIHSDRPYLHR